MLQFIYSNTKKYEQFSSDPNTFMYLWTRATFDSFLQVSSVSNFDVYKKRIPNIDKYIHVFLIS